VKEGHHFKDKKFHIYFLFINLLKEFLLFFFYSLCEQEFFKRLKRKSFLLYYFPFLINKNLIKR